MSDFHVPDSVVPIEAYRVWKITERGGLMSMVRADVWPVGRVVQARCQRGIHPAPELDCTCGLYALTRIDDVIARYGLGYAFGRVALWGTVVEGTRGYRASHGTVLELFDSPVWSRRPTGDLAALVGRDLSEVIDPSNVLVVGGPQQGVRPRPPGDTWVVPDDSPGSTPFPPTSRQPNEDHDLDLEYWSNVETDTSTKLRFWCYRFDGRVFRLDAVVEHPSDWEVEHEPSAVRPTAAGPTRR